MAFYRRAIGRAATARVAESLAPIGRIRVGILDSQSEHGLLLERYLTLAGWMLKGSTVCVCVCVRRSHAFYNLSYTHLEANNSIG